MGDQGAIDALFYQPLVVFGIEESDGGAAHDTAIARGESSQPLVGDPPRILPGGAATQCLNGDPGSAPDPQSPGPKPAEKF
ncbi:hypothetical protein ES703_118554 [subsurface metagenome]